MEKTNYNLPEVFLNILDLKSWAWKIDHISTFHYQIVETVHLEKAREREIWKKVTLFPLNTMISQNMVLFLNFIDYAITVVLIFPPLLPSTQQPHHSLRQSAQLCSCPWVMDISSLATPFPILYFTSPWLFSYY